MASPFWVRIVLTQELLLRWRSKDQKWQTVSILTILQGTTMTPFPSPSRATISERLLRHLRPKHQLRICNSRKPLNFCVTNPRRLRRPPNPFITQTNETRKLRFFLVFLFALNRLVTFEYGFRIQTFHIGYQRFALVQRNLGFGLRNSCNSLLTDAFKRIFAYLKDFGEN